jgi:membrane protein DedA with SNARE-associated domain
MTETADWLLTGLLNHGSWLLGAALFLSAFGVPLPATMLLMAAGAFTRQGVFAVEGAFLAAASGAVAGDACSYLLGRLGLRLVPQALLAAGSWQQATALFARWGGWSVFVTRFLLTPAALPVNLLAGSSRYPWSRFMAAVVAGELLWVLLFGGLGHLFAAQWEQWSQLATDFAGLAVGGALVIAGLGVLLTARRRRRARAAPQLAP